ncbi:vacuolar-sorting protein SNF8, putative [Entamoeba invadens IP1]|uniref:Vacuolar-sorting protein SNF8, putative n=1 Tax=Entamoeba invadens IP1 TaxID=370355 RepID=A0A0A1UHB3_ENTIV|nr:vacuolar-sorting protein SNF8, putative [Entamoeba invadens IP1]ELP95022.1 vacuolar-sorting protein SNF8, putative [Entamoeba invadens IP1]|eukprot:XP_004261793.1 vacuolar-sorting protein SNF8, putative [Entamoeba invadens IP1]
MSKKAAEMRMRKKNSIKSVGKDLNRTEMEEMQKQMKMFKEGLESFAEKHQEEIKRNPDLRGKFFGLCRRMGVDPLRSQKGVLSVLFGNAQFLNELTVQVIEECYKSRGLNGGLIALEQLCANLNMKRNLQGTEIKASDISDAIRFANCLGNGLQIVEIHGKKFVTSVPFEFGEDQTLLLGLLEDKPYFVDKELTQIGWSRERIKAACMGLMDEGVLWVDDQFPCDEKEEEKMDDDLDIEVLDNLSQKNVEKAYWISKFTV